MSRLSVAIDVAAEYAAHLHRADGVPKARAIQIGAAAVVRAVQTNPARHVPPRRKNLDAGVGGPGSALMGVGSLLSALGWIRNLVTGG